MIPSSVSPLQSLSQFRNCLTMTRAESQLMTHLNDLWALKITLAPGAQTRELRLGS
jgi:hypothetical protein